MNDRVRNILIVLHDAMKDNHIHQIERVDDALVIVYSETDEDGTYLRMDYDPETNQLTRHGQVISADQV